MSACTEEKTEFTFDELDDSAKQHALDKARNWDVEHDSWWDVIFEDAAHMGALMGIFIDTETRKCKNKTREWAVEEISIHFSGFWSQGDGASFTGRYAYVPDAIAKIKAECNDATLVGIAEELTSLQATTSLQYGSTLATNIIRDSSRYSHSNTMDCSDTVLDGYVNSDEDYSIDEEEKELIDLMRRFADWIYNSLEAEHDYLTSDEYVRERLKDGYLFNVDGEIV